MQPDTQWPAAPTMRDSKLPPEQLAREQQLRTAHLPPARLKQLVTLDELAVIAEATLIPADAEGEKVMVPEDVGYRNAEQHVAFCLAQLAELKNLSLPVPNFEALAQASIAHHEARKQEIANAPREKFESMTAKEKLEFRTLPHKHTHGQLFIDWAMLPEVEPLTMIFTAAQLHHIYPMRGDIAVLHDGHCGIITASQCGPCVNTTAAAFTPRSQAQIVPSVYPQLFWKANLKALIRLVVG